MDRIWENIKFKNVLCSSITLATIHLFYELLFKKWTKQRAIKDKNENFQNASDTNWDTDSTLVW